MAFPWESRTYVAVSAATSAILDELPEDKFLQTIIARNQQDGDLVDFLLYYGATNYTTQIKQYYAFGRDSHIDGLPFTNYQNAYHNVAAVNAVIAGIEGEAVSIAFSNLNKPDIYTWGRWYLQENDPNYNYNDNTYFLTPNMYNVDNIRYFGSGFAVDLVRQSNPEITFLLGPINNLPANDIYYNVEYEVDSNPGVRKVWLYQASLGTHPTLDEVEIQDTSGIFPVIALRYNDVNIKDDPNQTELYADNVAIMKKIKMDYDQLSDNVTSTTDADGNSQPIPDLNLISDIFFFYGINVYGESQQELEALYSFFDSLRLFARVNKAAFINDIGQSLVQVTQNTFSAISGNFNFVLQFNFVERTVVTGVIGTPGHLTSQVVINNDTTINHDEAGGSQSIDRKVLYIRRQITFDTYEQLEVDGPIFRHQINTVRGPRNYETILEAFTSGQELNDAQRMAVVPFNNTFLESLDNIKGDKYIPKTAHILFYASDQQKVSAFENFIGSFVAPVLQLFSIVLLFGSLGTASGPAEFFWTLGKYLAFKFAFEYVMRELFLHYEGNEGAQAVIAIVGTYIAFEFLTYNVKDLSTADAILAGVNAGAMTIGSKYLADIQLLLDRETEFTELYDRSGHEEKLEEAQQFLEVLNRLDVYSVIADNTFSYERPEDFYTRTLNTAPGQMVFDQLHNYVDNNLNLDLLRRA